MDRPTRARARHCRGRSCSAGCRPAQAAPIHPSLKLKELPTPDVHIQTTREGAAPEQESELIRGTTELLILSHGSALQATLRCSIRPKSFVDLLTLIHVDGEWRVIAKVFHWEA
ncbi:nuclear transport factor 2 family protein [Rubrivivax rivuli]|uniref:Nuclear transport factor 2 family protein n=1 Tax=Rubrivivax rivuli TaxID=1862385 RepID=A0A437RAS5_9BURK|nr:nuclear transport factor 2 family protein [Rubrivivax rivuli]RVU43900.1 hypothetical protein EOE66_19800 [Rubrivivax rivuli]